MYLYLLYEKAKALDAFKTYNAEVEKQKENKIKIVRSNRGGEYYDRYILKGQMLGLFAKLKGQMLGQFAKFLKKEGFIAQYTMPSTPQQNGVTKRRNYTLMDVVRCMISNSDLP